MNTINEKLKRIRYGDGLTYAELRARLKSHSDADVWAAVTWGIDNKVIGTFWQTINGVSVTLFNRVKA
jgi:hypothetical protein